MVEFDFIFNRTFIIIPGDTDIEIEGQERLSTKIFKTWEYIRWAQKNNDSIVVFVTSKDEFNATVKDSEEEISLIFNYKKDYFKLKSRVIYIFSHGFKSGSKKKYSVFEESTKVIYLDYSIGSGTVDQDYWERICDSKTIEEIIDVLKEWLRCFTIDPFRRAKHRGLNLFVPLHTDLQALGEHLENKRFDEFLDEMKNLYREWERKKPIELLYEWHYLITGQTFINYKPSINLPAGQALDYWKNKIEFPDKESIWEKILSHLDLTILENNGEKNFSYNKNENISCFLNLIYDFAWIIFYDRYNKNELLDLLSNNNKDFFNILWSHSCKYKFNNNCEQKWESFKQIFLDDKNKTISNDRPLNFYKWLEHLSYLLEEFIKKTGSIQIRVKNEMADH